VLTSGACSSDDSGSATGPAAQGGTATIALPTEARGMDPTVAAVNGVGDGNRLAALYDVLFWMDPRTGRVNPGIGESLTPADDGRVWTMKLRPGVRFSDGSAFDADAVRFMYERHADPANRSPQMSSAAGLRMQVVDPITLRIELPAPNAHFDRVVAKNLTYIASAEAYRKDPKGFAAHPVGAGPFVLKEWTRDAEMKLARNPAYWQPGKPVLDGVVFKVVPDIQQAMSAVATGRASGMVTVDYQLIDKGRKDGVTVEQLDLSGGKMIAFNTARPPFDDVRARRAVALALSADGFNSTVYQGKAPAARGMFAPGTPFHDPSTRTPDDDADAAQRLLDQLAAEGRPLEFTFTTYASPPSVKSAEYIQSRLAGLRNVKMRTETLEPGAVTLKTQISRDFQASLFSLWIDDPEPALYAFLRSGGTSDWTGYANPDVDRALDTARASTDPAVRAAAYTAVQRRLDEDLPVWVFQNAVAAVAHKGRLTGVALFNDGTLLYDRLALTA
ncbi:MAG: ABC transporter substrate-binding protein, partial [Streptomycetaceae bacterium]|nr:ABC transporter substrate-binding protein [Streptomycetaceae bacterium]